MMKPHLHLVRVSSRKVFRFVSLAIAVCFAASVFALAPGSAAAAVRCYGATCRGKDPQLMGCATDARTISISPIPGTAGAGWN